MTTPTTRTRDFSTAASEGPVTFTIDGVEYHGIPAIPARRFGAFMELATKLGEVGAKIGEDDASVDATMNEFIDLSLQGLDMVLDTESAQAIASRVESNDDPIDVSTLVSVFGWLSEVYATRRKDGEDEGDANDPFSDDASE